MGDVPTHSYLPIVYYQRRDQGLKSSGFEQLYGTYFNICGQRRRSSSDSRHPSTVQPLKIKTRRTLFSGP
jgi:hypothetical protein